MDDIDRTLGRIPEEDWVLSGPGDGENPPFAERMPLDTDFPGGVSLHIAAVGADGPGGVLMGLAAYLKRRRARRRRATLDDE